MADNIPEGLDDLLNSIRGEGKSQKSSAIVVVPKSQRSGSDSIADEDIDPVILRLLGLEDVVDIDYDTYRTLLKEANIKYGVVGKDKIPTEELMLLQEEIKRIRGKTGRFKVKGQKIKKESFVGKKKSSGISIVKGALPGAARAKDVRPVTPEPVTPETKAVGDPLALISDKISKVSDNVKEAVEFFAKSEKQKKKVANKERVAKDAATKQEKENKAEGIRTRTRIPSILKKAIAPVKNIFDTMTEIFQKIAVGTLVMELIRFLENPIEYFRPIVNWGNGMIDKVNEFTKNFVTSTTNKINDVITNFNSKLKGFQDKINDITSKIPFGLVPPVDLGQIGLLDASSIAGKISIPHIPYFSESSNGNAQESSGASSQTESSVNLFAGKLLSSSAKTTYYDPSLGGINASGAKTASGLPATSTGEGYDPNKFTAAAFPELIEKLPTSMTTAAPGFRGGRTLARNQAFNVIVTSKDGKSAVIRVNDVGPGVSGHSKNHLLDFSVAAKNYLGTGEGFSVRMAPSGSTPGPVLPSQTKSAVQLSTSSTTSKTPPPPPKKPRMGITPVPISPQSNGGATSGSNANQKQIPIFSATDGTNQTALSVKSLYNIVE